MLSDLRFALRSLARARGFTLVTVLTLALGIGSAAAIFSVCEWALFRANNFPTNLYLVGGRDNQARINPIRFDFMVQAYATQTSVLAEMAKASLQTGNVVLDGDPLTTGWLAVSSNLFPLLGVAPGQGRGFLPGEDAEGADQVVVVTHQFWRRQLGERKDVLGTKLTVGDSVCTIVGVLREGQAMPFYLYNEVYRPLSYRVDPAQPWLTQMFVLAWLQPGVTREQAVAALAAAPLDVPPMLKNFAENDRPALSSMGELNQGYRAEIFWVLLGAVGFLYAIACLNTSNLMLVRMLGQRRDLCIRLALGGGRWRVIRLLAVESLTLAVLGGLGGLLMAKWLFPILLSAAGGGAGTTSWSGWALSWRVLGAMGAVTLLTSLAITVLPALRVLRTDVSSGLKDGGAALGEGRGLARLRGSFVVLQAAFAVILLAGAGLMIRTFHQLQQVDLGFDPTGRAKVQIGFPNDYVFTPETRLARMCDIQTELAKIPGVRAVGFDSDILLPGYYFPSFDIEGPEGKPLKVVMGGFNRGYQDASGLILKRGHWLEQSKGVEIMVNESLARALWPDQDPVGQTVRPNNGGRMAPGTKVQGWVVAGVVGDVRSTLRESPGLYLYRAEQEVAYGMNTFIVRMSGEYDDALAGTIRRGLYTFDPRVVVRQIQPINRLRESQLWAERLANSVLKVLATIALLLTVVGLFSVLAYTVDRRLGEFGVRLALGATPRDLVDLVMRRGVQLTGLGLLLGLGCTVLLTRYLQTLLFETSPNDPWVLAAVGGLLLLTSILACALPARRATKVDITKLLRSE